VAWRHRRTQEVRLLPRPVQTVLIPLIVLTGTVLGRYRGSDWPGAPGRCVDAPAMAVPRSAGSGPAARTA
jgi:hypothetical protein